MTVAEWLRNTFGKSADYILGIDDAFLGGCTFKQPMLMAADGGRLQFSCGGDIIMQWTTQGERGRVVLVRDDTAGQRWEGERRNTEWSRPYPPKPFAVLRLVYCV